MYFWEIKFIKLGMRTQLKIKSRKKDSSSQKPRTRRRSRRTSNPGKKSLSQSPPPQDAHGFVDLLLKRVSWNQLNQLENLRKHPAGRPAEKLTRAGLLVGLVFHYGVHWAGSFAEHLLCLGLVMAESTLSQRRQALPWEVFAELLRLVLRPLAKPAQHPDAFYRGLRLVALDGTEFSLPNTSGINGRLPKHRNQRGEAAFAKLNVSALVELFSHNPLAARMGIKDESEWKLSQQLLSQLPSQCLLLADRLYGCGAFLLAAWKVLRPRGGHFLVRGRKSIKAVRVLRKLRDGSQLVELTIYDPVHNSKEIGKVKARQIVAQVKRAGFRPVRALLWTSLLDAKEAPARELVELYARRWEHELYFRELKHTLGVGALLRSQTVETAAQEVAAMIITTALVAGERAQLKPGESWDRRISFIKTWQYLEPLWLTLQLCGDLMSAEQKEQMAERFYQHVARLKRPKKRIRSCPRAVRKPQQPWPRKRNQPSHTGPVSISILGAKA